MGHAPNGVCLRLLGKSFWLVLVVHYLPEVLVGWDGNGC